MLALMPWDSATPAIEAPGRRAWATTWFLSSGLYRRLLGAAAFASLAMVCIIFIAHTMHEGCGYLKMGWPDAYSLSNVPVVGCRNTDTPREERRVESIERSGGGVSEQ